MNTRKVKCHRNSDIKNGQTQQNYRIETVSNELLGAFSMIYLFTDEDNPIFRPVYV